MSRPQANCSVFQINPGITFLGQTEPCEANTEVDSKYCYSEYARRCTGAECKRDRPELFFVPSSTHRGRSRHAHSKQVAARLHPPLSPGGGDSTVPLNAGPGAVQTEQQLCLVNGRMVSWCGSLVATRGAGPRRRWGGPVPARRGTRIKEQPP